MNLLLYQLTLESYLHLIYDNVDFTLLYSSAYLKIDSRFNWEINTSVKKSEMISLEAKIALLEEILKVYKDTYQYFKTSPYAKLEKK